MIIALLAAAALGSSPAPVNAAAWAAVSNYPGLASSLRSERGWTRVEVTIDEDGDPARCDLVASSGSQALDRAACEVALRHGHFRPARDEAGRPVAGTLRQTYAIGNTVPAGIVADMMLAVSSVPPSLGNPIATLRLVTGASGQVDSCMFDASSGSQQLDRLACRLMTAEALAPARDANGAAIRAVRLTAVGFTAAAPPPN